MKTFEELKYRFEFIAAAMSKKGFTVDKFCLEPPVSETELSKYENKWDKKLPDEMRRFFLEVTGKIVFDWWDPDEEWYDYDEYGNRILLRGPLNNVSHEFDPLYRWPLGGGFEWSLKKMDWIYEKIWSNDWKEGFNYESPYHLPSPYDYSYSYPFITGEGGELFALYAPSSGGRPVFHCGDTCLETWHKVADSFEEFWNNWSLVGCPHFGSYECFYNEKLQKLDPFCKDAITWRRVLGIEHLENQSG